MLVVAGISTDRTYLRRLPAARPRRFYTLLKVSISEPVYPEATQVLVAVVEQSVYALSAAAYGIIKSARSVRVESLLAKTLKARFVPKFARPDTF